MTFGELEINKGFTTEEHSDVVYTKVSKKNASCCTPSHNATYKENGKTRFHLFKDEDLVKPIVVQESKNAGLLDQLKQVKLKNKNKGEA